MTTIYSIMKLISLESITRCYVGKNEDILKYLGVVKYGNNYSLEGNIHANVE